MFPWLFIGMGLGKRSRLNLPEPSERVVRIAFALSQIVFLLFVLSFITRLL